MGAIVVVFADYGAAQKTKRRSEQIRKDQFFKN
jgi:hypothetical protein